MPLDRHEQSGRAVILAVLIGVLIAVSVGLVIVVTELTTRPPSATPPSAQGPAAQADFPTLPSPGPRSETPETQKGRQA